MSRNPDDYLQAAIMYTAAFFLSIRYDIPLVTVYFGRCAGLLGTIGVALAMRERLLKELMNAA